MPTAMVATATAKIAGMLGLNAGPTPDGRQILTMLNRSEKGKTRNSELC